MGTQTYEKNGAVSKKDHATKDAGKEAYLESRMQRPDAMCGGPDPYERKWSNNYRKTALNPKGKDGDGDMDGSPMMPYRRY